MAAQLFASARRALPALDEDLAGGSFAPLLAWLREHVHRRGGMRLLPALVEDATGAPLGTEALLAHLDGRLAELDAR